MKQHKEQTEATQVR